MNSYNITIDQIKSKCVEEGECWIWNAAISAEGYPIMKRYGCPCVLVRRVSIAIDGRPPAARQPVVSTCGQKLCVNPNHLSRSSWKKVGKRAAENKSFSGIVRCSKIAMAARVGKSAKITAEIAQEIRESAGTHREISQRFGISKSLVTKIRAGKAWKNYHDPFISLKSCASMKTRT